MAGLEPARRLRQGILSPRCLPFHHISALHIIVSRRYYVKMKEVISVSGIQIGAGKPKVCIPVSGKTVEEVQAAFKHALEQGADILEFRLDSILEEPDFNKASEYMRIFENRNGVPLLMTYRSQAEGGKGRGHWEKQRDMLLALMAERESDLIDLEISHPAYDVLLACAAEYKIPVVASMHFFDRTPERSEIFSKLDRAGSAAILKFACMPQKEEDVLRVMELALEAEKKYCRPVIAIAMGRMGVLSRIGAELCHCCMTFGNAGEQSAPGQPSAVWLKETINKIHLEMRK